MVSPGLQPDGLRDYRLDRLDDERLVWQQLLDGTWECNYRVSLRPRHYTDFAAMCHYHQTSPNSPFTRQRLCTLATPIGRITLTDSRLIVTQGSERHVHTPVDEAEFGAWLELYFGINRLP